MNIYKATSLCTLMSLDVEPGVTIMCKTCGFATPAYALMASHVTSDKATVRNWVRSLYPAAA